MRASLTGMYTPEENWPTAPDDRQGVKPRAENDILRTLETAILLNSPP
jgi:hypothetical protein